MLQVCCLESDELASGWGSSFHWLVEGLQSWTIGGCCCSTLLGVRAVLHYVKARVPGCGTAGWGAAIVDGCGGRG